MERVLLPKGVRRDGPCRQMVKVSCYCLTVMASGGLSLLIIH
jgi:hypothetical protein